MKIFDNHPNFKWMHVMFMILGTSFKENLPVDAFSDYCVNVYQSRNWSCELELELECPIVTLTDRHNPVQKPRKNAANL